jgi:UDP-N-acetylglucosamine 4,6-dehydratase
MINQKIVIIGGTGSLGHCLMRRMYYDNEMSIYSRDELKQWEMKRHFPETRFIVGDVRDEVAVKRMLHSVKPDVVIIAAALKHVDVCEENPQESMKTNISGTENVLRAVEELDTDVTTLFVSTDKACSPVNVYGMCKALAERLVSERSSASLNTKFLSVRYGNVINSRGSIIPLFMRQAIDPTIPAFTVTEKGMTRFFMTLDESVDLIQHAIVHGKSGELWVPRLRSATIDDLAAIFAERYGKPVVYSGIRPGEKIHESLVNIAESMRTAWNGTYYVISPPGAKGDGEMFEFSSNDSLSSKPELEEFLIQNHVFDGVDEL